MLDLQVVAERTGSRVEAVEKFDDVLVAVREGFREHAEGASSLKRYPHDGLQFDPKGLQLAMSYRQYFCGKAKAWIFYRVARI